MNGEYRDLFFRIFELALKQEDSLSKMARTIVGAAADANISKRDLQDAIDWYFSDPT